MTENEVPRLGSILARLRDERKAVTLGSLGAWLAEFIIEESGQKWNDLSTKMQRRYIDAAQQLFDEGWEQGWEDRIKACQQMH